MTGSEILAAFQALPQHRRHDAMRIAASYALDVWERYVFGGKPIEYVDGVVGGQHVMDMELPMRAIAAVDRKLRGEAVDGKAIWEAYSEPIVAMQDGDLDLPDNIASAYYAIYNLVGIIFGKTQAYDEGEIVIRQAYAVDGFLEEWWTRVWDAWATRGDAVYAPTELDEATFERIAKGDLSGAIEACAKDTRLHTVLLALAGRRDEANTVATALFGVELDPLRVGDNNSIVVGDRLYAAICGDRHVVRQLDTHDMRLSGRCAFPIRRVAFSTNGQIVIFAGDERDEIASFKTVLTGEELYSPDYGYRIELRGTRTIAGLGPGVDVVPASDREVGLLDGGGYTKFGDGRVSGAVFDDNGTYLVTYAGASFAVWDCAKKKQIHGQETAADIWHAVFTERRLVIAMRNGQSHVLDVSRFG